MHIRCCIRFSLPSPPLPPVSSRARALAHHGTPTERAVTIFQRLQEEEQYGENKERRRVQSRRESNNMNKSTNKNNKKDKKDKKNKKDEKNESRKMRYRPTTRSDP